MPSIFGASQFDLKPNAGCGNWLLREVGRTSRQRPKGVRAKGATTYEH